MAQLLLVGATTIEVKSSHLSLISHPKEIAALILQAAGRNEAHRSS